MSEPAQVACDTVIFVDVIASDAAHPALCHRLISKDQEQSGANLPSSCKSRITFP